MKLVKLESFRRTAIVALAGAGVVAGLWMPARTLDAVAQDEEADVLTVRFRQGLEIAPVPLDLEGRNRVLVGLGSYIVNAQGGCNDCHTFPSFAEGGDPYLGQPTMINSEVYLAGGRPFGPDVVSANITPDENGLPAGLTLEEFMELMRTGRDEDEPGEILQVMPWPIFANMTDRDLRAVYEYLSAIPALPDNMPPEG
jgi:hypothetical protein